MSRYRLLYIWVNDNRSLKNKEFHLNRKYFFSYNMNSARLSITGPETSYIDDFYSNAEEKNSTESTTIQEESTGAIIDFSAIVGNNAVGKTTLLNFIHKYASKAGKIVSDNYSDFDNRDLQDLFSLQYIIIYLDIDSIDAHLYAVPYNVRINTDFSKITVTELLPAHRPQTIYLTNTFNFSDYVKAQHFHDDYNLATGHLMYPLTDSQKTEFTDNPIIRYEHKEILRQSTIINSVSSDGSLSTAFQNLGFTIPKHLVFVLKSSFWDEEGFPGIDLDLETQEKSDELKTKIVNLKECLNICAKHSYSKLDFPHNDNANVKISLCHVLIQSLITSISKASPSNIYNVLEISAEHWNNYSTIICEHYENIDDAIKYIKDFFEILKRKFDKAAIQTIVNNHINFLDSFIKWVDQRFDSHESITPSICVRTQNYISRTDFDEFGLDAKQYTNKNDLFNVTLYGVTIADFMKEYEKISKYFASFSFAWEGLSSGESALLSLFGRLFSIKDKTKDCQNLILLLDEADMLLHPEWQRNYINVLHGVIPSIFPNKNIQVILATHSPLMLSDIPKQNILFLHKDNGLTKAIEGEETFAANVFSLYQDSFFIKETGIGAFAKSKLTDIVSWIREDPITSKYSNDEIEKLINAVGDEYLRAKLKKEFLIYRSKGKSGIGDDLNTALRKRLREMETQLLMYKTKVGETEYDPN